MTPREVYVLCARVSSGLATIGAYALLKLLESSTQLAVFYGKPAVNFALRAQLVNSNVKLLLQRGILVQQRLYRLRRQVWRASRANVTLAMGENLRRRGRQLALVGVVLESSAHLSHPRMA